MKKAARILLAAVALLGFSFSSAQTVKHVIINSPAVYTNYFPAGVAGHVQDVSVIANILPGSFTVPAGKTWRVQSWCEDLGLTPLDSALTIVPVRHTIDLYYRWTGTTYVQVANPIPAGTYSNLHVQVSLTGDYTSSVVANKYRGYCRLYSVIYEF